mgnify:CR=1 FL=1
MANTTSENNEMKSITMSITLTKEMNFLEFKTRYDYDDNETALKVWNKLFEITDGEVDAGVEDLDTGAEDYVYTALDNLKKDAEEELENDEDKVINFVINTEKEKSNYDTMDKDNFRLYSYDDYKDYVLGEILNIPEGMRRFFDLNKFILHQWNYNRCEGGSEFYIVCEDDDGDMKMLEDIGERFDVYKGKEEEAFALIAGKFWIVEYHP